MKSATFWGLAALNLLLLGFALNRYLPSQAAHAQVGRPSDYLMVPGTLNGVTTGVVFVLDTSKSELSMFTYEDASDKFSSMPKIALDQVFRAGSGVAPGNNPGKLKPR